MPQSVLATVATDISECVDSYSYPSAECRHSDIEVQSIHEQGSSLFNEDVLLIADGIYGVFDGATSLESNRLGNTQPGGYVAASIAAEAFQDNAQDLLAAAKLANQRIDSEWEKAGFSCEKNDIRWSTSVAVIQVQGNAVEYCQSGDAVILFLMRDGSFHCVGGDIDIDRDTLQMWKDIEWSEGLSIYTALAEQIKDVRQGMNTEYGVLNGDPKAMDFLDSGTFNRDHIEEVLLFTDGLTVPREEPSEEYSWQKFVDLYREKGLHGLHQYIRKIQKNDPLCRLYPRFKQHDDIAAIALSFNDL
jgi:hypothetical protein